MAVLVGANDVGTVQSGRGGLCGWVDVERNVGGVGGCGGGIRRR